MEKRSTIVQLKQVCPLPVLLKRLGLSAFSKSSCKSPLRTDENPSWGIFERNGQWFYKDHATGDSGDEISFLAAYFRVDIRKDFNFIMDKYEEIAAACPGLKQSQPRAEIVAAGKLPDRSGLGKGTEADISSLALLRGYEPHVLERLMDLGLLVFGFFNGFRVFGLTDSSGRALEVRRLDGQQFPPYGSMGARKSHSLKHSQKAWPVGVTHVMEAPMILLCEGVPDYLAAWSIVEAENALGRVVPVTMLGAATRISIEAIEAFRSKHVRIAPHNDDAGIKAAKAWHNQLKSIAAKIDFLSLRGLVKPDGSPVKDLDDYKYLHRNSLEERRVLQ